MGNGVGVGVHCGARQGHTVRKNQGLQRPIKELLCERGNLGGVTRVHTAWRGMKAPSDDGGVGERLEDGLREGVAGWRDSSSSSASFLSHRAELQGALFSLFSGEVLSVCPTWSGCLDPFSRRKQVSSTPHPHTSWSRVKGQNQV